MAEKENTGTDHPSGLDLTGSEIIPRKDITDGIELGRLLSCRRYSGILGLTNSRMDCGFGIKMGECNADDLIRERSAIYASCAPAVAPNARK
jgi:hypothetical protein